MRVHDLSKISILSAADIRDRRLARLTRLVAVLVVLFPVLAAAAAGLRPPDLYGPLAERVSGVEPSVRFGPGQPLLPMTRAGLFSFATEVDSTGAAYRRMVSGFSDGPPVYLSLDQYLDFEYGHRRRSLWQEQLRRGFRGAAVRQLRADRERFKWSVPFPESRTLRRIVGEEGPTLSLSGHRTITIAGKSEWTAGEVRTAAGGPSKFPSLRMEQNSEFTVEGKVGELINIRINQDTESLGSAFTSGLGDQLANQIKLDYKGDEDAIFQEVQAGNTTLELPSTRFVGFRQQNKGLFGIRAKGRLGPLAFTTIASHEKSKSNRKTYKGGASVDTSVVRDWQYLRNTYFFLDEFYRANLPDFRKVAQGTSIGREEYVDPATLSLYVNDFNTLNDAEDLAQPGVAYVDPDLPREETGWVERGTWRRLDPDDDYTLVSELGYVILDRAVQDRHALAVTYRTVGGRQVGGRGQAVGDSLRLKLVKARDARYGFPTWNLEWKNVYRIGGSSYGTAKKFNRSTVDVQILREVAGKEPEPSQDGRSYLQLFGLDQRGQDPGSAPDRLIDKDYDGLDEYRGHLILPDQTPFDPQYPTYQNLKETAPAIYTSQQQRDLTEASRYVLQVRSSSTEQRINLGGGLGGIRAETVEARVNGKQLQRGTDFNVDYVGNVSFLGAVAQEVNDPGVDLEITYESDDLLGLGSQQKTLLGLRTEYEFWGGEGRLGSTLIYNNERTSERRVRVGSEPTRTVIWDLDLKAKRPVPLLTRAVDALPLLKTAAPSEVSLEAELAQSRPNLNTKGAGYIDDFEGSERPSSLSSGRIHWTPSAVPADPRFPAVDRGRLVWYNPYSGVLRTEIWPNEEDQVDAQNNQTDVLALELTGDPDQAGSWGGVTTAFSTVSDFSQSKFIEIWLRGEEGTLHLDLGAINEDVDGDGRIDSEDHPLPGRSTGDGVVSDEEDVGIDGRTDLEELNYYLLARDAAFDTTLSVAERRAAYERLYPDPDPRHPNRTSEDPEGDNWQYDSSRQRDDYSRINGTQGNKSDRETSDRPDSEDQNDDGVLSRQDGYYHYEANLATGEYEVPDTRSPKGWRQLRLPLYDPTVARVGALLDSTRIEYARLMLSGAPKASGEPVRVEIALIEVVGNEWQEDEVAVLSDIYPVGSGEGLNVTVVGTDRNPAYRPPPGVHLRRNPNSGTREREQSLVLAYTGLEPGHQMAATKILSRAASYTDYRRLRLHVHGDSTEVGYVRGDSSDLELFVRFGADSTNYYEYITRVFPGWEGGRSGWRGNEVDVDLLQMSRLKAVLQSGRLDLLEAAPVYVVLDPRGSGVPAQSLLSPEALTEVRRAGHDPVVALELAVVDPARRDGEPAIYRVRGNPSMQQIKRLSLGLRSRAPSQRLDGQIFLDELLLDDARNDAGLAAFARVNTQLADFMVLDSQVQWQQEDFRTVTGSGGNSTDLSGSLQATTQVHQFLPGSWGFSIPVKMQLVNEVSLPRFGPNSDVELTAVEKDSLRSTYTKEFYDLSISRRQGRNWLLNWTLDQVSFRLSHSRENRSTPVRPLDDQQAQTMSFSYRMPLPKTSLTLLGWLPGLAPEGLRKLQFSYLPANLGYSMGANRRVTASYQAADVDRTTGQADTTRQEEFRLNETYTAKVSPIAPLTGDYSLRIDRDLRKQFEPGSLSFGREVGRKQTASVSANLQLVKWLDQNYTFEADYEENSDPSQRRVQTVVDSLDGMPIKTRDITTKNDLSARFNLKVPALLKGLGRGGSGAGIRRPAGDRKKETDVDEAEGGQPQAPAPPPPAPTEGSPGKPFLLWRALAFSGDYLEPFTATWRRGTSARGYNLVRRPGWLYQLGIEDSLRVARAGIGLTQQDAWSQTTTLEVGSGLRLPLGVSVKTNYNDKLERRSGSSQTRLRVLKEERFPRVDVSWNRIDRLPYVKKLVTGPQVTVAYEKSRNREGEQTVRPEDLISRGSNRNLRITWNWRWRFGPSTGVEQVFNRGTTLDYELGGGQDSTAAAGTVLRGSSAQDKRTTTVTVRHNLRPRSLPLFGKLKSSVDFKYELAFEAETRSSATGYSERAPITDTARWWTATTVSYSFTDNFRGEGVVRVENNDNRLTDKTRKIREVRLSGTFYLK
ncbi:MAG: cell surface protein SprA [Candidatus Latescibacterota bacterium]|jgi:hypothetical protein